MRGLVVVVLNLIAGVIAGVIAGLWGPAAADVVGAGRAPQIVIVIDDLGASAAAIERVIALPEPVTAAVLPYPRGAPEAARRLGAAGVSVIVHMPMEPYGLADPGPGALTSWQTPEVIADRVAAAFARVPGAVGLNNHMGSRFTACAQCVRALAAAPALEGRLVLDSVTSPRSRLLPAALAAGRPALARDVFLDARPGAEAVLDALAEVEAIARVRGLAIAIGHPHEATLDTLAAWMPEAAARGVVFVTLEEALAAPVG